MLTVVLVIGILSGLGVSFYSGLTRDTHERTQLDHLRSFLTACRQRAALRGMPVRLQMTGNILSPIDAPGLTCTLGASLSEGTRRALAGLSFTATAAWIADQPVTSMNLVFVGPSTLDGSRPSERQIPLHLLEP